MADISQDPSPLGVEIGWEDGVPVLRVSGELDVASVELLEAALTSLERDEPVVVIDLREVTFADTAGLRPILDATSRAISHAMIRVVNLPSSVAMLARALPDVEAALRDDSVDDAPLSS